MKGQYITNKDIRSRTNSNVIELPKGTIVNGQIIPFMKTFGLMEEGFEWRGVWINKNDLDPYTPPDGKTIVKQQPAQGSTTGNIQQPTLNNPVQSFVPGGELPPEIIPGSGTGKTVAPSQPVTTYSGTTQQVQSLSFFSTYKKEILIGSALLILLLLTSNDN